MSSLALKPYGGLLFGLRGSAAGDSARNVDCLTVKAIQELKANVQAGSSLVFNELQALVEDSDFALRAQATFQLAQRFLLALPAHLPGPELALDSDGEVSFDWSGFGGRMLTVTLREDGRISYAARISPLDRDHGTKQFVDAIPGLVVDLVERVTGE